MAYWFSKDGESEGWLVRITVDVLRGSYATIFPQLDERAICGGRNSLKEQGLTVGLERATGFEPATLSLGS
jgi:hypothetical protein